MNNKSNQGSVSLMGITFLIFLVLKLTGLINWSWWLVTLPLWGGIVLWMAVFLIFFLISTFITLFSIRR